MELKQITAVKTYNGVTQLVALQKKLDSLYVVHVSYIRALPKRKDRNSKRKQKTRKTDHDK